MGAIPYPSFLCKADYGTNYIFSPTPLKHIFKCSYVKMHLLTLVAGVYGE